VGVVFLFLFYYDNTILVTLNIYPEKIFKDAIINYRDDADQQDFIDYWQKEVRVNVRVWSVTIAQFYQSET
jgi:hypothetical protein